MSRNKSKRVSYKHSRYDLATLLYKIKIHPSENETAKKPNKQTIDYPQKEERKKTTALFYSDEN